MCKIGVNEWSKQQRIAKKASSELLTRVSCGEVLAEDISTLQAEIESARSAINYDALPTSYETLEMALLSHSGELA